MEKQKVYVLTPAALKGLGYVAKVVEDGKTVLVPNADTNMCATNQTITTSTHKNSNVLPNAPCVTASGYSRTSKEKGRRRILHGFTKHWTSSLNSIGFIKCPLVNCNFISLDYRQMCDHYGTCNGVINSTKHLCVNCDCCLQTKGDLECHKSKSHAGTVVKPTKSTEIERTCTKGMLLVRKRGYSKIHIQAWNISLNEKGFIKCIFQNCNFMALDVQEMIEHYRLCNAKCEDLLHICVYCNSGVSTAEKLQRHIQRSHSTEQPDHAQCPLDRGKTVVDVLQKNPNTGFTFQKAGTSQSGITSVQESCRQHTDVLEMAEVQCNEYEPVESVEERDPLMDDCVSYKILSDRDVKTEGKTVAADCMSLPLLSDDRTQLIAAPTRQSTNMIRPRILNLLSSKNNKTTIVEHISKPLSECQQLGYSKSIEIDSHQQLSSVKNYEANEECQIYGRDPIQPIRLSQKMLNTATKNSFGKTLSHHDQNSILLAKQEEPISTNIILTQSLSSPQYINMKGTSTRKCFPPSKRTRVTAKNTNEKMLIYKGNTRHVVKSEDIQLEENEDNLFMAKLHISSNITNNSKDDIHIDNSSYELYMQDAVPDNSSEVIIETSYISPCEYIISDILEEPSHNLSNCSYVPVDDTPLTTGLEATSVCERSDGQALNSLYMDEYTIVSSPSTDVSLQTQQETISQEQPLVPYSEEVCNIFTSPVQSTSNSIITFGNRLVCTDAITIHDAKKNIADASSTFDGLLKYKCEFLPLHTEVVHIKEELVIQQKPQNHDQQKGILQTSSVVLETQILSNSRNDKIVPGITSSLEESLIRSCEVTAFDETTSEMCSIPAGPAADGSKETVVSIENMNNDINACRSSPQDDRKQSFKKVLNPTVLPLPVKKRRGRPPKNKGGTMEEKILSSSGVAIDHHVQILQQLPATFDIQSSDTVEPQQSVSVKCSHDAQANNPVQEALPVTRRCMEMSSNSETSEKVVNENPSTLAESEGMEKSFGSRKREVASGNESSKPVIQSGKKMKLDTLVLQDKETIERTSSDLEPCRIELVQDNSSFIQRPEPNVIEHSVPKQKGRNLRKSNVSVEVASPCILTINSEISVRQGRMQLRVSRNTPAIRSGAKRKTKVKCKVHCESVPSAPTESRNIKRDESTSHIDLSAEKNTVSDFVEITEEKSEPKRDGTEEMVDTSKGRARGRGRGRGKGRGRGRGSYKTNVSFSNDEISLANTLEKKPIDPDDSRNEDIELLNESYSATNHVREEPSINTSSLISPIIQRGPGRIKGKERMVLSTTEAKRETERNKLSPDKVIKCVLCSMEMPLKKFPPHNKKKHSGLSWIEGEQEVDLDDIDQVRHILVRVYKPAEKKAITCQKCGTVKRSIEGFISHIQLTCQKSTEEREALKVCCPLCHRMMMQSSIKVHMVQSHRDGETDQTHSVLDSEKITMPEGRKRGAAIKAESRMMEIMQEDKNEIQDNPETVTGREKEKQLYTQKGGCLHSQNSLTARFKRSLTLHGQAACSYPGCTFNSTDLNVIVNHHKNCPLMPLLSFHCKLCLFNCESESVMKEHVVTAHAVTDCPGSSDEDFHQNLSEPDEDDEDEVDLGTKRQTTDPTILPNRTYKRIKFLNQEVYHQVSADQPFSPAVKWMLEFERENYQEGLFRFLHTTVFDWTHVSMEEAADYLPVEQQSMPISNLVMASGVKTPLAANTLEWRHFSLFEADVVNDVPVFYAGGPVWATAWVTVPTRVLFGPTEVNQFLAVSCHRHMDDVFSVDNSHSGKGLIQIWDFGHLDNVRPCCLPRFALGICHRYGTVWHMEWCPSGAYEEADSCGRLRRLGLLAAACSDGAIHVFSVPFPSQLQGLESQGTLPIFQCEPVLTLVLGANQLLQSSATWMCSRFSWHKAKGHQHIAGGFTNGMVALWDVNTDSSMLVRTQGKTRLVAAYHTFQAHLGSVNAVSLFPHLGGRFLMTGGTDRYTKVWDLEQTQLPIMSALKNMVTDGAWMTHWISVLSAYDDGFGILHTNSMLHPVRNYGYAAYPILPQNSPVWSISTSDWSNAVAQGTLAGELCVIFPHQLFVGVDAEKGMKKKRLVISFIDVLEPAGMNKNVVAGEESNCSSHLEELKDFRLAQDVDNVKPISCQDIIPNAIESLARCSQLGKPINKELNVESKHASDEEDSYDTESLSTSKGFDASSSEDENSFSECEFKNKCFQAAQYDEVAQKFKLAFCNYSTNNLKTVPEEARSCMRQSDKMRSLPTEMYPISSINRVSWNPNARSYLWLAAGYQCGIVSVPCIRGMKSMETNRLFSKAMASKVNHE